MVKKLEVAFQQTTKNLTLLERKYTLTHSDRTGQRYLYIGPDFAKDRYSKLRDEVLGEWVEIDVGVELHIKCTLDSKSSSLTIEERYDKFKEHMNRAIIAIINGDRKYIVSRDLLSKNVSVHFESNVRSIKEHYGKVKDYLEAPY